MQLAHSRDLQIRRAIGDRCLIQVGYNGKRRIAEPHDYGRQHDSDRLLVYQLRIDGAPARSDEIGWRLFNVDKIDSLAVLPEHFKGSRRHDGQDHHAWDILYARVDERR